MTDEEIPIFIIKSGMVVYRDSCHKPHNMFKLQEMEFYIKKDVERTHTKNSEIRKAIEPINEFLQNKKIPCEDEECYKIIKTINSLLKDVG